MNTFGNIYRLTTAGESHGPALVGIIDGMPAGVVVDRESIDSYLALRSPGRAGVGSSSRKEPDHVEILSGMIDGQTLGTPIGFIIRNQDAHSEDYEHLAHAFRPSHADFTYHMKYGIRDYRGGGRASARETALRIVGGSFALAALLKYNVRVMAFTTQIGSVRLTRPLTELDLGDQGANIWQYTMRCPDRDTNERMEELVQRVQESGDTIGGVITCIINGLPAGIGEPVYGKFQAQLASAMMSINAVKGFDYGMGFDGVNRLGSEMNDPFVLDHQGHITTLTNHSGGIQGGITNGRAVVCRVAFKPIATLMREVETLDENGNKVILPARGRHDSCAVPRAVPVVQSMAAMVALDALLQAQSGKI